MAEQLLFLAENLFSDVQNPTYTLTADQEAAGYEAWHVATGRRQLLDRWQPTTANADHWIKVDCGSGVTRAVTCCAIDRASNHAGKRFILEGSANGSSWTGLFDCTVPSAAGGAPADANGGLTDEGAWLKTFAAATYRYFRLTSKAMGAGLVPQLTGVWLGTAWAPTEYVLVFPLEDDVFDVRFEETVSPQGWAGRAQVAAPRTGTLQVRPASTTDYARIRSDVLGLYARQGHPAWICWQKTDRPTAAFLARCPAGRVGFPLDRANMPYRLVDIPYLEEQPA